jgi:hypothetical protein
MLEGSKGPECRCEAIHVWTAMDMGILRQIKPLQGSAAAAERQKILRGCHIERYASEIRERCKRDV